MRGGGGGIGRVLPEQEPDRIPWRTSCHRVFGIKKPKEGPVCALHRRFARQVQLGLGGRLAWPLESFKAGLESETYEYFRCQWEAACMVLNRKYGWPAAYGGHIYIYSFCFERSCWLKSGTLVPGIP